MVFIVRMDYSSRASVVLRKAVTALQILKLNNEYPV